MFRFLLVLMVCLPGMVAAEAKVPQAQSEITLSFAPLVRQAAPAVVNIYAKRIVETRASPFSADPFFGDFFREFGQSQPRVQNSLGSGVILSADGLIVSNYHVVGQATDIRVVLTDRREYSATVLLGDQESDLAVLQVQDAGALPFLALRDTETVEVGELVLAIGNPFGVGQTVSSGIVSGLARSGTATGNARGHFVQTDAPINPGNSGGALIDVAGNLIGINTSILSRSGGSNGIGFAIPANLVAEFVRQAEEGQDRFQRPWAGIGGQAVDSDLAEGLGLKSPGGIVISELHQKSPFRAAGVTPGDVIIAVNGQPVFSPPAMIYQMTVAGLGRRATVTRVRDGRVDEVIVDMIAPPDSPERDARILTAQDVLEGLEVANVNPAVIAEYGLANTVQGVVVTNPGPLGARVGLAAGDMILAIGRSRVAHSRDVGQMLQDAGRRISMTVQRGPQRITLSFRR